MMDLVLAWRALGMGTSFDMWGDGTGEDESAFRVDLGEHHDVPLCCESGGWQVLGGESVEH